MHSTWLRSESGLRDEGLFKTIASWLIPPAAPSVPVRTKALIQRLVTECAGLILDLGSGNRTLHPKVVRLDIVRRLNISVQGDARRLPFSSEVFDLIICSHALEHVDGMYDAVVEAKRVLRPKGLMLIEVPFIYPFHPETSNDEHDYVRLTPAGLRRIASGLQVLEEGLSIGHGSMLALVLPIWFGRFFFFGNHSAGYHFVHNVLTWLLYPLCWLDSWLDRRPMKEYLGGSYFILVRKPNINES